MFSEMGIGMAPYRLLILGNLPIYQSLLLVHAHVACRMSHVTIFLKPCCMSISSMSDVKFKKDCVALSDLRARVEWWISFLFLLLLLLIFFFFFRGGGGGRLQPRVRVSFSSSFSAFIGCL